jgi:hypothetical protein
MKHKQEAQAKKPRDSRGFATNGVIVIAGKMLALPR